MKKIWLIIALMFILPVMAEETQTSQTIDNEKSNVSINLNSQIKPDGNELKSKQSVIVAVGSISI